MKRILISLATLSVLIGCGPEWRTVKGPVIETKSGGVLKAPTGWKYMIKDKQVLITPDSPDLAVLCYQTLDAEKPLARVKQKIQTDMLAEDLAAVITDNYRFTSEYSQFKVVETSPATINENDAFLILSEYKSTDGNPMKMLTMGYSKGNKAYIFEFTAPKRVYFDKMKPEMERIISLFVLQLAE
ncbi:MAG: hypothetical protein L6Q77_07555 [Bacteroidetes bacterium]|nr:hypothetical protein [Bacteroidota bacterium]